LFAAGFALWAAAWTWSDLIDAEGFTRLLEPAGSTQSPYAPERDWRRLTTASRINPLRAEYPYHQAQASRYLPMVGPQHEGSIPSAADQSIKSFERALSLRPHWGVAWAELAVARSANKERSAATLRALDRALAFAPSEPFVRRTELRIGLSLWDRLDSHWRERVMAAARYIWWSMSLDSQSG
jgi:hypothetical protein